VAGLNIAGVYYLFQQARINLPASLLLTSVYAFCFSNLVIYSIPETYQMSNLSVVVYLIVLFRLKDRLNFGNSLFLSGFALIGALYNFPLMMLMGIHLVLMLSHTGLWRWVLIAVANALFGLTGFLFVNYLIYRADFLGFIFSYSERWATLSHFLQIENIGNVLVNFFYFAVISPVDSLPKTLHWQDGAGYFSTILRVVLVVSWTVWLVYVIYYLMKTRAVSMLNKAVSVWIVAMAAFYVYFNPNEATLYSSQTILPMLLICAELFESLSLRRQFRWAILAVFCVLLAINNGAAFY
jgi:hypothetical protein